MTSPHSEALVRDEHALVDCFNAGCTRAYKTFAEMAAHRLSEHRVPIDETYADGEEPWPPASVSTAAPPARPGRVARSDSRTRTMTRKPSRPCGYCKRAPGHSATCPRGPSPGAATNGRRRRHRAPVVASPLTSNGEPRGTLVVRVRELVARVAAGKAAQAELAKIRQALARVKEDMR